MRGLTHADLTSRLQLRTKVEGENLAEWLVEITITPDSDVGGNFASTYERCPFTNVSNRPAAQTSPSTGRICDQFMRWCAPGRSKLKAANDERMLSSIKGDDADISAEALQVYC